MCLYSKRRKPMIAKQDIICYKVLVHTPYTTRTPFEKYELLRPYLETKEFGTSGVNGLWSIDRGIHAYSNFAVAKMKVTQHYFSNAKGNKVVHIATIPAGTKYYSGSKNDVCALFMIIGEPLTLSHHV